MTDKVTQFTRKHTRKLTSQGTNQNGIKLHAGEMTKADPIIAEEFQARMTLNQSYDPVTQKIEPYPLTIDNSQLGQYGTGLRLFFHFNKYLALVFWIMALISIPSLISNSSGDGMSSFGERANQLAKLSLANQPELTLTLPQSNSTDAELTEVNTSNQQNIEDFVDRQNDRQLMVVIPDLVYSIVFLIFIGLFQMDSARIIKETKAKNILPSKFTVEVSGFPRTVIHEGDVASHFEKLGYSVYECQLARNYHGTLFLHRQQSELLYKVQLQEAQISLGQKRNEQLIEKLWNRLDVVEEKVQKIVTRKFGKTLRHDQYPSVKAYVTFNKITERNACIREYTKLNKYLFCKPKWEEKYKMFGLHEIQVFACKDEPSNIKWENLDVKPIEKCWRLVVVILLVFLLMLITFSIIMVANIVQPDNSQSCPKDMKYTIDEIKAYNDSNLRDCWCQNQSTSQILNDKDVNQYCWDSYVTSMTTFILTIVTGFVVWLVNFLLKNLLNQLGEFARYTTLTQKTVGTTIKLFVVMFINTALITLILQADVFGYQPAIIISNPIPPLQLLQEQKQNQFSADFDRNWYVEIGSKMTTTMIIAILNPHCLFLVLLPVYRWMRAKQAKSAIIQREMNNNSVGPVYDLTQFYALLLNTTFVCLFYSSGIPILLWFAAATFTIQYFCFQYFLLRYNKRPPTYDNELNDKVLQALPSSVILHLAIGIYMYGSPLIFPNDSSSISAQVNSELAQQGISTITVASAEGQVILSRAYSVLYLTVLFLAVLAFYIFDVTVIKYSKILYEANSQTQITPEGQGAKEFKDIVIDLEKQMLASYDIKQNEDYADIVQAIDNQVTHESKALKTLTSARGVLVSQEENHGLVINDSQEI